jgi:serine/threonine protein kinase
MQTEELSPEELSSLLGSYMPDIPGYRVIRRIGKGGMSYVYLGVQVSLDRQVAIKVMSPEALTDEKSKQRFEQEAHTIAKLEHPCIVGVHEVGRTPQGLLYYVLPYLARGHLGQRDFTNDEGRIIEVLRALLSALEYAHTRGIVHRDVKAENVLFDNADRPLLTDFGIALKRNDTSRITTAGLAIGSGGYMAPEQARGEAVDGRADLYSVGVLAYELLNGRLPYLSSDPLGLALMHAQDPIPRLPVERKHWQPFLDRSMAKSPDNRFRNAQQMLGMLNQLSQRERPAEPQPEPPAPVSVPMPVSRPWLRPTLFAAGGAALVLLALLFLRPASVKPEASTEFFTGAPAASAPAASSPAESAPAASAPAPDLSDAATATAAPPAPASPSPSPAAPTPAPVAAASPPPVAPPAATPDTASPAAPAIVGLAAFAAVKTSVSVNALDFDPALPGARELHDARRQIKQNRLSTPVGDNAIDSLTAAVHAGAPVGETAPLIDQVITGLGTMLFTAMKANDGKAIEAAYHRAQQYATNSGHLQGAAWKNLRQGLPPLLIARLEKSLAASDSAALAQNKALAKTLEVDPKLLEPAWSREIPQAKLGNVVATSSGPAVVLVVLASGTHPGVAFMREEVSHSDYAKFASATARPVSKCKNRTAPINFKKRTWVDPGFAQTGAHPAVCVSFEDASAYAKWLSQRTGETYRLPTAAEWRHIVAYKSSGNACQEGRVSCGQDGTVPVNQGPASPFGLSGVRGNAREWLNDCVGSCTERLVGGLGWRDSATRADPTRTSGFDSSTGFDDIGFRLVREVPSR